MKDVDLDEPTSFSDHENLGCAQRECKPNEAIIEETPRCLNHVFLQEQQKIAWVGKTSRKKLHNLMTWKEMLKNAWKDTVNWQTRKLSNCTKFQVLAWMITNSKKRNLNQWENCPKYAHKLH